MPRFSASGGVFLGQQQNPAETLKTIREKILEQRFSGVGEFRGVGGFRDHPER